MKGIAAALLCVAVIFGLMGCNVSKPYITETDRVDQQLTGNRGYLVGTPPPAAERNNLKRPFITVDIDFPEIKGQAAPKTKLIGMEKVTDTINAMALVPSSGKSSESEKDIK